MYARIWHGWTGSEQADAYEKLLRSEVFPAIRARCGEGLHRIELLRRLDGDEAGFVTIMWFADHAALDRFAGDDGEAAFVPNAARAILARFDHRARHYQMRDPSAC